MRTNREVQTRAHDARPFYTMNYRSPLDYPDGTKKDGYTARWVNYEMRGEGNYNVETRQNMGWEFVPSSRCTNKKVFNNPFRRNPSEDNITRKDVVFMEIEDEIHKRHMHQENVMASQPVRSLKGVSNNVAGKVNQFHIMDINGM